MAACPAEITIATHRRRPMVLTQRRIEANRRNAAHSTGPRTAEGKARVARNPIKHGFFVAQEKWTPQQHLEFEQTLDGLRNDLQPQGALEESCVCSMAQSYVRMASVLRYEDIAALEYHRRRDREMEERISSAEPAEAARLRAQRTRLRRAGLWRPTIPGPREAKAIVRYGGSLDRTIRRASVCLEGLKAMRLGEGPRKRQSSSAKVQKQTHFEASARSGPEAAEGPRMPQSSSPKLQKQTHFEASPRSGPEAAEGPRMAPASIHENAKTNPLSSMFTGNRHERRRANALARRC